MMGGCLIKDQELVLPLCKQHSPWVKVHGASGPPETPPGDSVGPAVASLAWDNVTETSGSAYKSHTVHYFKSRRIKAKTNT